MPSVDLLPLTDSTRRLVRSVDALDEPLLAAPSLLPGWTRAHVVAHLALNAEAMARGAEGARTQEPVALYESPEARASDIDELSAATCTELRERFLASTAALAEVLGSLLESTLPVEVEWYPGGMRRVLAQFPEIRRAEVEVHHVDLDTGAYDATSWPGDFRAWLIDSRARSLSPETGEASDVVPFTVYAGDLDRSWSVAGGTDADPVVTGSSADLAWWLSGRGDASGLASDHPLPRIAGW
ncbi:maleylpyruvate isomerase family mycothiol-dependent enzyme [Nocardioides sp. CFH 31398]|uniref:maleylpyruvate isomerase family mycothiol-dependent enzyme n=1 Tax=Nocardioides sp. CFH 31398 TaxID=2919579 RepID=UPI001F05D91E|nr:maleylpyruvate isomerase family mycothiol-dependent enzyme [Nocardioides sp. CFH 31398]MCH1866726.1 maleylpyruvate isomerase family mycothiol-dependent enzyme [Nocardioides sp. CFH 31398]